MVVIVTTTYPLDLEHQLQPLYALTVTFDFTNMELHPPSYSHFDFVP